MDKEKFQAWLISEKGLGDKSARDVISRCRRLERIFTLSLENTLSSSDDLQKLIQKIDVEVSPHLKLAASTTFVIPQLRRAATLYAEYKKLNRLS